MTPAPPSLTARVSRADLAHNRLVWMATGGMAVFMTAGAVAISLLNPTAFSDRQQWVAVVMGVFSLFILRAQPPAMEDRFNHVVLALVSTFSIVSLWAFQPGGGPAIGAAIFIGPLTAVKLQNRWHIAAHLAGATIGFTALAASGQVDQTTIICILVMAPAMWVLAFSCVIVLEASEAQGEELERLVRRDPLTGLGNRRLLDEQLAELIRRHERSGQDLSILALDLNGFKALNDTLGHAAGDELLRDTAAALERATRKEDVLIRQGGDEFLVILPGTSPAHAQRTINAIRAGLASSATGGLVSSGIGRATYPEDALTADVLLHVADERLIADKATGPKRGVLPPRSNPFDLPAEPALRNIERDATPTPPTS